MTQGAGVGVRPAGAADVPFIVDAERRPGIAPFVSQWSEAEHEAILRDGAAAHLVIEAGARPVGFVILRGLNGPDRCVELKRIVVTEPGRGFGRAALSLVKREVFERRGAHRLWLDVMEHNTRARRLYASEGFVEEGTLRQCLFRDGRFVSLVLMSILEEEYGRPPS